MYDFQSVSPKCEILKLILEGARLDNRLSEAVSKISSLENRVHNIERELSKKEESYDQG